RRLVQMRECRARALLDDDRLEVAEHRVLRGRGDALIREYARDEHGLGAERTQHELEVRVEERAQARLLDQPVVRRHLEVVVDLVAPGALPEAAVAEERA